MREGPIDRRRRALITAGLVAGGAPGLLGHAHAFQAGAISRLDPPADLTPRAVVHFAPERFDDLMWENDRVAHRIYGPALQAQEPPSGSGIDAWGKRVRWPFMERQIRAGRYHDDAGEGVDFYSVGASRGAGGLGVWHDDKLWTSRNFAAHRILESGGDRARFEVDYAPWSVDITRKVWETRQVSLALGSNFTRMRSTLSSDVDRPLLVGIGIARRRSAQGPGVLSRDPARGRLTFWEPETQHGAMGLALMVEPSRLAGFIDDADSHLMLIDVRPNEPFVYWMGSTWSRGADFQDPRSWQAHVDDQAPDFER